MSLIVCDMVKQRSNNKFVHKDDQKNEAIDKYQSLN